jgi:hypothetical protein
MKWAEMRAVARAQRLRDEKCGVESFGLLTAVVFAAANLP